MTQGAVNEQRFGTMFVLCIALFAFFCGRLYERIDRDRLRVHEHECDAAHGHYHPDEDRCFRVE